MTHAAPNEGANGADRADFLIVADADEVERLTNRGLDAVDKLNPYRDADRFRGRAAVVTPRAVTTRVDVTSFLHASSVVVHKLRDGFDVDRDDPTEWVGEQMYQAPPDDQPSTDDDPHSLRPLTIDELMAKPSPRWIVRNLFVEKGLAVVFGASGSGKTFFMLDLSAAIARGTRWFGRRVRQGGVVYVAGEGHLKLRIEAYLAHNGVTPADLSSFRVRPASVNLFADESGDLETLIVELRKCATEMGGIVLVVLDTLNAMMPGGDENNSIDMGRMIAAARRIMDALGCSVAYVHHSGKDESKGSRGHSSLKAATDLEIQITGDTAGRVATASKIRDGEPDQQFPFRLESVDLGADPDPDAEDGERLSSCAISKLDGVPVAAKKPVRRDVALDALREAIDAHGERMGGSSTIPPGVKAVKLDQWRQRWALRTGYATSSADSIRSNFNKDKDALLKRGAVAISDPFAWIA